MWEDNNHDGARMAAVGAVIFLSAALILALNARAGAPPPLFPPSPTGRLQAHGPGVLRAVTVDPFPSDVTVDEQTDRVFVVTGSTITVLDGRTGALVRTINQEDARPVTVATGAGTGRLFVVNSAIAGSSYPGGPGYHNPDGSVDVLDARTLRLIHSVRIAPGTRTAAVDARRGRIYILGSYTDAQDSGAPDPTSPGSVTVLDARDGRVLHTIDVGHAPTALALDPRTGRVFVTDRDSHDVTALDGGGGHVVTTIPLATAPFDVAVVPSPPRHPGAGRVFVATIGSVPAGRSVVMLDARSGAGVGAANAGYGARALAVDARANRVFVATDTGISVLDATTGAVLRRVGTGAIPGAMAIDVRSHHLFVVNTLTGGVGVFDTTGALLRTIAVGGDPLRAAIDTRTERVFVADGAADRVSVLDAVAVGRRRLLPPASSPVLSTAAESSPLSLELDTRAGRLFVVNDRSVSVLDARSGRPLRATRGTAFPLATAIDKANDRLFVFQTTNRDDATARGSVAFLSLRTGALVRTTRVGPFDAGGLPALVPDPHDRRVLAVVSTASQDAGLVYVLDALHGQLRYTTTVGPSPAAAIATRTGRLFVVCSGPNAGPGQVWVMDARTGRVIRTIPLHTAAPEPPVVDNRTGHVFIADDSALFVLDARDGATIHVLRGVAPESATLDERSGRVFVGNLRGLNTISMIDAATGAVLHTVHDGFDHVTLRVDDVTGRILAYPSDGTDNGYAALVLDGYTGVTRGAVALTGDIVAISPRTGHWLVAPPGSSVFTLDTAPGRLVVLDNRSGKILRSVTFGQPSGSLQIVGDARTGRVFVGDQGNQTVTILDATRL